MLKLIIMSTFILILSHLAAAVIGLIAATLWHKQKVITITDVYKPKTNEHPSKEAQSCVLQLSNEIIGSGALKKEKMLGNNIKITLMVIK